jgi:DNA replication protein DnaC
MSAPVKPVSGKAVLGMNTVLNTGQKIHEYAKYLKLTYIASNIDEELRKAKMLDMKPDQFLEELLHQETIGRSERSKKTRIKNAGFPFKKYLSDYDPECIPEGARKYLNELKTLDFITKGENIIAYGNPGTGKTHLAIGLGIEAANAGYSVKFYSVPTLVNQLKELKMHSSLLTIKNMFENTDLLILDELGYISFDREGGELLFTHLSMRSERKSTIVTTNVSVEKSKTIFNNPVLTAAIADRLSSEAFLLDMIGTSNRRKKA